MTRTKEEPSGGKAPTQAQSRRSRGNRNAQAARGNYTAQLRARVASGSFLKLEAGALKSEKLKVEQQTDARGRQHTVVVATERLPKCSVFKVVGDTIRGEDYDEHAVPQEVQDFHHSLKNGDILDASDPARSCMLRYIKHAHQPWEQNVQFQEHGSALYVITAQPVAAGEKLLAHWEWEGETLTTDEDRYTFFTEELGELITMEGEVVDI
ncbi:hypothetical protein COHA_003476 [Chlorella ohadii]|uniref:SET domain-containing protein n=1 Tax=Chlorella ohadii TaxID=2649997 RepID=A0AAD5DUR8_9CHLO|nr:hypothetical protein COHA_003476 [Chlorella ohadii]